MDFLQPIFHYLSLDYLKAHPDFAILIIFLIAFGEALLIIGLFVPSTVVLVSAGVLVGTGHLGFWPVFLATAVGAIAGDQISYWAGRLYGEKLKTFWPLNRYPQLVARGEDYVRQHGGKSIAIGRFVPGVKAVVPGIVGMLGMNQAFFLFVNFASGLVWTAFHVFPGIILGQGLSFAGELSGHLAIVLVMLLCTLGVAGWLIRLGAASLSPYLDSVLWRLSRWMRGINSRPLQRLGRVISPDHPRSYLTVMFMMFATIGGLVMIDMVLGMLVRSSVSNLDVSVSNLLLDLRSTPGDSLMVAITMLGDDIIILVLGVAVVGWLMLRKAWRAATAAGVILVSAKLIVLALKQLTMRPRPIPSLQDGAYESFAFPSSHVTMTAVVLGMIALLASQSLGRWSRALAATTAALAVITIGFSRMYLGAHWLSDVLGGLLLGGILLAGFAVIIEAIPARRIRPVLFSAYILALGLVAGSVHLATGYTNQIAFYAPPAKTRTMPIQEFLQAGSASLPTKRIDLSGTQGEIFAGQWLGELTDLQKTLEPQGWKSQQPWTWQGGIAYLDSQAQLDALPPRPLLHKGLTARYTAVRGDGEGRRLVLRAYRSDVVTTGEGTGKPVYFLSIVHESLPTSRRFYTLPRSTPLEASELQKWMNEISAYPGFQTVAGPPQLLMKRG